MRNVRLWHEPDQRGRSVDVAPTPPEALAAKAVTGTIPIVTATADAVGVGLAASHARPGGNVTGLTAVGATSKNCGFLVELLPGASRFAVLLDPDNGYHAQTMAGLQTSAAEWHLDILPAVKRSVEDIGPAFHTMASNNVHGVLVLADPIASANRRKIIELAAQNRIPDVYYWREDAVEGGLLAYGADLVDLNRRSAAYVARLESRGPPDRASRTIPVGDQSQNRQRTRPEHPDRATRDGRRAD